jgi:endonuclease/exonuclease/phosphatase family metal-dependent hydrolase
MLRITPKMLSPVGEIDELKGAWRALGTLAPERLSALRRVATIDSVGSSTRIEGSRLSDRAVEQLLANLTDVPLILLGDLNDGADSNTLSLITGQPNEDHRNGP